MTRARENGRKAYLRHSESKSRKQIKDPTANNFGTVNSIAANRKLKISRLQIYVAIDSPVACRPARESFVLFEKIENAPSPEIKRAWESYFYRKFPSDAEISIRDVKVKETEIFITLKNSLLYTY